MSRRLLALLLLLIACGCNSKPDLSSIAPPQDAWFGEQVTSQTVPVVVDFTASWCGPCTMLKPFLDQLETEHAGKIKVVPIDVDARSDLAEHYQVRGFPTLLIMRGGKVVDAQVGAFSSYESLMGWVGPHLK